LDQFNATQVPDLETLFQTCDVISMHCPGGHTNRHLINADIIAHSKPGLILINTARGEVVDEVALAQALHDGTIGGAGLDVFDGEPNIMPETLNAPNIVMLPHLGSATDETRVEMGMRAMENLNAIMSGKAPRDPVT
jgi:lactate dehydrogenase-like 2-hydroxyacid dehydrogenase